MGLKEAIQNLWESDYTQKNPNKAYKVSYQAEYTAVAAYLNGGAEPVWQNYSKLGKGLCEAEKHRRMEVVVPPDPVPPDPIPPDPNAKPLTNSITSGGTYAGTVTGTVSVNTTQAVVITNSTITNTSGGTLVNCSGAVDVTLDHVKAFGGVGRVLVADNFKRIVVSNCTIEKTSGIELLYGQPGSTVLITRNRHHNIQRVSVGNFVQFRVCQNPAIDVSWNEILNEYNLSDPEDIISIYYTAHTRIHDNYLQHQSKPGNAYNTSSQNSITLEGDARLNDNIIENNQVVDAFGVSVFNGSNPSGSGHDNSLLNNRVIADQFLPNGQQKGNGAGASMYIATGGQNNHAHGNVVGAIGRDGGQLHYDLAGAAEGHAAEVAKNTELPVSQINAAAEKAEWDRWLSKLQAAGIKVGA